MFLHSYDLETLAIVLTLNKFRIYLKGIPFTVLTDCNALRTTFTKRDLAPRIARWAFIAGIQLSYRIQAGVQHATRRCFE